MPWRGSRRPAPQQSRHGRAGAPFADRHVDSLRDGTFPVSEPGACLERAAFETPRGRTGAAPPFHQHHAETANRDRHERRQTPHHRLPARDCRGPRHWPAVEAWGVSGWPLVIGSWAEGVPSPALPCSGSIALRKRCRGFRKLEVLGRTAASARFNALSK